MRWQMTSLETLYWRRTSWLHWLKRLTIPNAAWREALRRCRKRCFIVVNNLDSALAGGHFRRDGWLYNVTALDIALDLKLYAEDCEDCKPADLLPYVREWLRLNEAAIANERRFDT